MTAVIVLFVLLFALALLVAWLFLQVDNLRYELELHSECFTRQRAYVEQAERDIDERHREMHRALCEVDRALDEQHRDLRRELRQGFETLGLVRAKPQPAVPARWVEAKDA